MAFDNPFGKSSNTEDTSTTGDGKTKDEVLNFLNQDDSDDEDKKEDKEDKEEDDDTSDDDKDGESGDDEADKDSESEEEEIKLSEEEDDEDDKPSEEDDKLIVPIKQFKKEVLKKYPTLFKDFPALEANYYKARQYTEILPTLDDAKEALEAKEVLSNFQDSLIAGDNTTILAQVKKVDPEAFNRIVDNYLPNLGKVDPQAWQAVVGNVVKNCIASMIKESKGDKENDLYIAAKIISKFAFNEEEAPDYTRLAKPVDQEAEKKLKEREESFIRERFETVQDDLDKRIKNQIKATIADNIDKNQSMTEYVRKTASREALELVESNVANDKEFKAVLDRLWTKAFKSDFKRDDVDAIRRAVLGKFKAELPGALKKVRNDALKGSSNKPRVIKKNRDDDDSSETKPRKSTSSEKVDKKMVDNKGRKLSTYEFLSQD